MNISIVIPVYNAEKFLSETLSSVKAQTIQPYEIVIVNDASTDRTRFIAEKYSSVIINHDQNEGIGASRQHGAEAASGDFIAFLSGDDVYYPHFLESCLPYLKKRDVATFTDYYRWYYTKGIRQLFKAPKCKTGKIFIEEVINWALRKNMFVNFSTVILPKWWFKVLKFQDFMKRSEDLPFLLDSIIAGYKWHHIPEPLLDYRIHRGQVTRNRSRQQFNLLWGEISTRLKILGVDEPKIREAIKESEEKYFESLLSRAIHKMIKLLS